MLQEGGMNFIMNIGVCGMGTLPARQTVLLRPPVKRGSNAGQAGQTGVKLTPGQGQCVTLRIASGYPRLARFGKAPTTSDNWEPAVVFLEQGCECLLGRGLQENNLTCQQVKTVVHGNIWRQCHQTVCNIPTMSEKKDWDEDIVGPWYLYVIMASAHQAVKRFYLP